MPVKPETAPRWICNGERQAVLAAPPSRVASPSANGLGKRVSCAIVSPVDSHFLYPSSVLRVSVHMLCVLGVMTKRYSWWTRTKCEVQRGIFSPTLGGTEASYFFSSSACTRILLHAVPRNSLCDN